MIKKEPRNASKYVANTNQLKRVINVLAMQKKPIHQTKIRQIIYGGNGSGNHTIKAALTFLVWLNIVKKIKSPTQGVRLYKLNKEERINMNEGFWSRIVRG